MQTSNTHHSSSSSRISSKTRTSTTKKPPPAKIFSCSFPKCGKSFSKKWNLQAHERLHTGNKPFVCRLGCGEAYMWMSSRKGHERNRCRYRNNAPALHAASGRRKKHPSTRHPKTPSAPSSQKSGTSANATDNHNHKMQPVLVLEDSWDCVSSVTEDVMEVDTPGSSFLHEADTVLADVSLPDRLNFTEDFLEWLFVTRENAA